MTLRTQLFERIHQLEERIDQLAKLLAVCFVVTFAVESLLEAHNTPANIHLVVEVMHWILLTADIVVSLLVVALLIFRRVGFERTNRSWWRITQDKDSNIRIRTWLKSNKTDEIECKVLFCSERYIDSLSDLNFHAFKNSVFAIEEEKLKKRNRAWAHRNYRIFMLILDPLSSQEYIGYSSMLPLVAEGMDDYLKGKLKDSDIPAAFVARDRASTEGVLLFAIHLRNEFSFTKNRASTNYSLYFLACVRHHFLTLFSNASDRRSDYPALYVQTDQKALERRLLRQYGFVDTRRQSADGYKILVLKRPFRETKHRPISIREVVDDSAQYVSGSLEEK